MQIIDNHCDVLSKMLLDSSIDFYEDDGKLDVTYSKLIHSHVKVQGFAIYLPEAWTPHRIEQVMQSVDLLYSKVLRNNCTYLIRSRQDFINIMGNNNLIGAIMTLEGVDGLQGNLMHLRNLYRLGLRVVGITWNYANWAADGVMEPRNGGFTFQGRKLLQECEQLGIILDVSHLSEQGFWELEEHTYRPFIASHSNTFAVCPHPRNLQDSQINAVISRNGIMGITFVPWFVAQGGTVRIEQILPHIEHVCSLGGEHIIAFGSDFDGIDKKISGLEDAGQYDRLVTVLQQHYTENQVKAFLYGNMANFLHTQLPAE